MPMNNHVGDCQLSVSVLTKHEKLLYNILPGERDNEMVKKNILVK